MFTRSVSILVLVLRTKVLVLVLGATVLDLVLLLPLLVFTTSLALSETVATVSLRNLHAITF